MKWFFRTWGYLGVLALLIGMLAYPDPAVGAVTLKLRCPGAGGKTIVRTPQARVFTRVSPDLRDPRTPDYYGCLYRRKTAFRISLLDDYVTVGNRTIRLAGRYVAFGQTLSCAACGSDLRGQARRSRSVDGPRAVRGSEIRTQRASRACDGRRPHAERLGCLHLLRSGRASSRCERKHRQGSRSRARHRPDIPRSERRREDDHLHEKRRAPDGPAALTRSELGTSEGTRVLSASYYGR